MRELLSEKTSIDIDNRTERQWRSAECTLPFVGCCIFHSDLLSWKLEHQIYNSGPLFFLSGVKLIIEH